MDQSVIYLLSDRESVIDNQKLVAAQQSALNHKLSLAVVYAHESGGKLPGWLEKTEIDLAEYDIPLLVLLGQADKVLPGLFGHVQPQAVFSSDSPTKNLTVELEKHPTKWPGRVITFQELQKLIDSNDIMC